MGLIEVLASGVGGSVLGTAGAFATRLIDNKKELKLAQLKLDAAEKQNAHEVKVLELSAANQQELAAYKLVESSIESDKATYATAGASKWLVAVDVVRGLTRPVLTATLLIYCMAILFYLSDKYPQVVLSQDQVYGLMNQIVSSLVVCSSMALSWWFGSRSLNK